MNTNGGHFQFQLKPTVGGGQVQHSISTCLLLRSRHCDFSCRKDTFYIHVTNQSPKNPDFEGGRVLEQSGSRCAFCLQREQGCLNSHAATLPSPKIPSKGPQMRYLEVISPRRIGATIEPANMITGIRLVKPSDWTLRYRKGR